MRRHLLKDRQVRTARPKAKPYRLADGDGLYLFVPPSGVRSWQLRYSLHGKQQTATQGKLTEINLAEARDAAHEARKGVAKGIHLTVAKRVEMAKRRVATDNTFKAVAADWVNSEAQRAKWTPAYRREVEASLKNHLRDLNALPLVEVTAPVVAPVMRVVEHSAPYMVEKVRRRLRVILDYGVEQGVIVGNPLPSTRRGPKIERRHFPAVTNLEGVGAILRAHDAAEACKGVRRAHQILVFTALRPGEVVPAR